MNTIQPTKLAAARKQWHDGFGNPPQGPVSDSGSALNHLGLPSVFGGTYYEVGKPIDTRGPNEIGTVDDILAGKE